MAGDLLTKARRDFKQFSQAEFSDDILFVVEDVTVQGLVSRHHMSIDPMTGASVSSLNAHVSINEDVLNDAGITTRNGNNQFILKDTLISFKDAKGIDNNYIIEQVFPSQTLGIIVMILGWHS